MAGGNLELRTRASGHDELAELGGALDLLAVNLSAAIGALQRERDLLSGIVSAMHEGLLVLDDQGRIAMVNPALRQMLLLGSGIVGRYPLEVIRHADFLVEAATRAADAVRPQADAKGIRLEIGIPLDLRARGDERAIEQLLLNLLDNAVKYSPSAGRVTVTAKADGARCSVEVRDAGIGIEAKHLTRLFERFYRIDKGRGRDMGGTGLGLSIVKHLAAALHGEVAVESQPGKGSTFTVVLPRAAAPVEQRPAVS